ncbi:MAG: ATP synthase F0 subunit C [Deltaproteobacteria bacterium]|nr:ATP synthase F0 subunit C [Deltaproteobacteria bacterium]
MALLKKVTAMASMAFVSVLLYAPAAFAEGAAADNDFTVKGFIALAAGLAIGVAAFGGALAQGKAAAATLEGIARNPGASGKMFVPMILALALIESLVIYALVIAFTLVGKL